MLLRKTLQMNITLAILILMIQILSMKSIIMLTLILWIVIMKVIIIMLKEYVLVQYYPNIMNIMDLEAVINFAYHNMTRVTHLLNLIASTDISNISDENYNNLSKTTFGKLQAFWHLVSRSLVASDKLFEHCNCKFPVLIVTRWNSKYDAAKKNCITLK